jgi:TonB family protein
MKLVSTHVRVVIAGILLATCSPITRGQDKPQSPSKIQIGNGLQILTPTQGADFSGYGRDLLASIRRNWIASLPDSVKAGQTGIVAVIVQVRADGTFLNPDPKLDRSSGRAALDSAAVAAVRASAPFPHFPSTFEGATVELRITFYYNIPFKKPITTPEPAKSEPAENSRR